MNLLNHTLAFLTVPQVAEMLGVSEAAIYMAVCRRQLPVYRWGRRLRFRLQDIESLLEEGFTPPRDDLDQNGWSQ